MQASRPSPASVPPRLSESPTVLTPEPILPTPDAERRIGGAPVHPLAALLLLFVDNLWNLADWAVIGWIITIPLSFLTVFVPTVLIQRFIKRDPLGRAVAVAGLLGVLAAVPTSITGTPAGLAFLAWTGLDRLLGKGFPASSRGGRVGHGSGA